MANNLKKYRKLYGFTQQQVADVIGVSRESYNALELGKSMPSLLVADSLAQLFRADLYQLWALGSESHYKAVVADSFQAGRNAVVDELMHAADALDF